MSWVMAISALLSPVWWLLNWSYTLFRGFGFRFAARPYRELRPFALPLWLVSTGPDLVVHPNWGTRIAFGFGAVAWLVIRFDKDDDDRWKRRRKRLASKVAEVGGRLQVVPAGSS